MERRAKVELFEQIRREYEFGVGTIRGSGAEAGGASADGAPGVGERGTAGAQAGQARSGRRSGRCSPFIDAILEADRTRRASSGIRRIGSTTDQGASCRAPGGGGDGAACMCGERKQELGWSTRETCVPQSYEPGQEGQVDWYEAWAELSGEQVKLQVFSMRSMVSGAAFHRAYHRATQQAFLEAHEQAFHYFGGVFRLLRYDNLKSAVKKILRGHRREETTRFIAFRSHWRFASDFCTPREPHEKGGIEGEAGYFRRNHWVPMPQARDLDELNAQLLAACHEDERRQIAGHRRRSARR